MTPSKKKKPRYKDPKKKSMVSINVAESINLNSGSFTNQNSGFKAIYSY